MEIVLSWPPWRALVKGPADRLGNSARGFAPPDLSPRRWASGRTSRGRAPPSGASIQKLAPAEPALEPR